MRNQNGRAGVSSFALVVAFMCAAVACSARTDGGKTDAGSDGDVKASKPPDADPSPYDHMIYRATSADGLTFTFENSMLISHASVPQAYADSTGRVWVYYLDFTNFPAQRESISAVYENDDYTLSTPRSVQFDTLPSNTWANNPGPVRIP